MLTQWSETVHPVGRGSAFLRTVGRLNDGVTLEIARAELTALGTRLEAEFPAANTGVGYAVFPLKNDVVNEATPALWVLLGAVGFMLLIVCVNLANLLLARGAARTGEFSVRAALGARGARLGGQLLTESSLLAVIGGGLGIFLALFGTSLLVALAPSETPRIHEVGVSVRVLTFAVLTTVGSGLLFGLAPALRAARVRLRSGLTAGGRGLGSGRGGFRLRRILVVGQVALAMVLLIGAGLFVRSFQELTRIDLGYEPEGVATFRYFLPSAGYPDAATLRTFQRGLEERVSELPGVTSAGSISSLPLTDNNSDTDFQIEGLPAPQPGQERTTWIRRITAGYVETAGLNLSAGRAFNDADRDGSIPVVMVNATLAERYFPGEDPIGRRINIDGQQDPIWREIVGVVRPVRHFGVRDEGRAATYFPYSQRPTRG